MVDSINSWTGSPKGYPYFWETTRLSLSLYIYIYVIQAPTLSRLNARLRLKLLREELPEAVRKSRKGLGLKVSSRASLQAGAVPESQ